MGRRRSPPAIPDCPGAAVSTAEASAAVRERAKAITAKARRLRLTPPPGPKPKNPNLMEVTHPEQYHAREPLSVPPKVFMPQSLSNLAAHQIVQMVGSRSPSNRYPSAGSYSQHGHTKTHFCNSQGVQPTCLTGKNTILSLHTYRKAH